MFYEFGLVYPMPQLLRGRFAMAVCSWLVVSIGHCIFIGLVYPLQQLVHRRFAMAIIMFMDGCV